MKIVVDAVGGDHVPASPVAGAIQALGDSDEIEIVLCGPKSVIEEELARHDGYDKGRIHILEADQTIGMDEAPTQAVKSKQQSSIVVGLKALAGGQAHAFVSAGNTGALLTASTLILGRLEGIIRPTIAALFPTMKGHRLLVDAGANLDVKPDMLVQFAKMGRIYLEQILNVEEPKIGLLNVGEEPEKGTETHKTAFQKLSELPGFVGNVEGKDILFGKADLYVTDGFTGNVLLKFGESFPNALTGFLGKTMKEKGMSPDKMQEIAKIIKESLTTFDAELVGGIPFLGVNGISMVGHGGSTPLAIKNMVLNAASCVKNEVNAKIVASL